MAYRARGVPESLPDSANLTRLDVVPSEVVHPGLAGGWICQAPKDKNGKDVANPAFEFDGCFDPNGSNNPTGVDLNPKTPAPTTPAAIAVATASLRPDKNGLIHPALTCSPGQEGCGGIITATLDRQPLSTVTHALAPGKNGNIQFQLNTHQAGAGGTLVP